MIFSLCWLNMDTMSTSMAMSIYKIMETSQPKSILIITVTCKMTCLMITTIAGAAESGSLKVDLPKAIENLRLIKVILSINLQLVPLENILTTSASLNTIRPKATLSTQRTNSLDLLLLQSLPRNSTWRLKVSWMTTQPQIHSSKTFSCRPWEWKRFFLTNLTRVFMRINMSMSSERKTLNSSLKSQLRKTKQESHILFLFLLLGISRC